MRTYRSQLFVLGTVGLLALVGSLIGSKPYRLQAAGGPTVTLDAAQLPLPVKLTAGSNQVSGTVAATQSGDWKVQSGDATKLVDSFAGQIQIGFNEAAGGDITAYKSVRVLTNCFAGGTCANILVRVYSIVGGRSYLVEEFPMKNFVVAGGVYETFGTRIDVQLVNNTGGVVDNIGVAVFGRAN